MTDNRISYPWQIIPRTSLETLFLTHPTIQKGLSWSKPAIGHPEKSVGQHVFQVLQNIDQIVDNAKTKERLRLAAILHDTFKFQEDRLNPATFHGLLARKFMAQYSNDTFLLDLLEWHDEAYKSWVIGFFQNNFLLAEKRIHELIKRFDANIEEYQQFFICDSKMMDKRTQPVLWFNKKVREF